MAEIGWCEEVDVNDQSDGARVGNQATRMVRATQRTDTSVFVRYKKPSDGGFLSSTAG